MTALTRRERETEQTRELIVEAARDLFVTKGYENVTVRDIAARAGISHGTIYLHFRDKDDLLYQVSEEQFRRLLARLRRLPRSRDISFRLRDALLTVATFGIEEPHDYQMMMGFREALGASKGSDQWGPMADQVGDFFDDLVREAVASGLLAADDTRNANLTMISILNGVVLTSIISDLDESAATDLARFSVDCLVAGLGTAERDESQASCGDG